MLNAELEAPASVMFSELGSEPVAAASLGQVRESKVDALTLRVFARWCMHETEVLAGSALLHSMFCQRPDQY